MKLVLISVYDDIMAPGIRFLSSYVKKNGCDVKIIFLPVSATSSSMISDSKECKITEEVLLDMKFSNKIIKQIYDLCKDADLIGISLFTSYFQKAKNLTIALKKIMESKNKITPILWGGIDPTLNPLRGLKYADMVVVGDGEKTILKLLQTISRKKSLKNIKGLLFKNGDKIIKNDPRENEQNLDDYSEQDFDLEDHYVLDNGKLLQITPKLLYKFNGDVFSTMTTRGCPHSCTYCGNNALREASCGKYVRFRSTKHVLDEIEKQIKNFPFFKKIAFYDDVFFIRKKEDIKEFAKGYKKRIGLPILCNISPQTVDEEKIRWMVDAGLSNLTMGVQSGSNRMNYDIYKRFTSRKMILNGAKIIHKFAKLKKLSIGYQFIIDNPYETNQDIRDTASLLLKLPHPYTAGFYPLVFYPKTKLYEMAKKDNLIKYGINDVNQSYWDFKRTKHFNFATYAMLFIYFSQNIFPKKISIIFYNTLMNDFSLFLFNRKIIISLIYNLGLLYRKIFKKGFGREIK